MIEVEQLQKYKEKVSREAYIAILEIAMRANLAFREAQKDGVALYQGLTIASQALAQIKAIVRSDDAQVKNKE